MVNHQLQQLITELQQGNDRQRRAASYNLGKIKDPAAVSALIDAFKDKDSSVQRNVVDGLRAIGSKEALDFLAGKQRGTAIPNNADSDQQSVKGSGEFSSISGVELQSQAKTVEGTLPIMESIKSTKVIVSFQDPESLSGVKGIEFLLDGNSKGLLQFGDIKEFEIPAGEHTAKMILHGVVKRSSKELNFSIREGQIVCIEGNYSRAWGTMNIGLARDQSVSGKLIELQKKVNESICNVCGKKSFNGETEIVVTGRIGEKERHGNTIVQNYTDLHRIRVFICGECKKGKGSFAKAVMKKDTEFGRIGQFGYWRSKDFPYFNLPSGSVAYLFIKDKMKDELDDHSQNKNGTLIFHSPRTGGLYGSQFQGGIWIDGILIALLSYEKGFDISINVSAGKHTISLGTAILNDNTRLTVYTEENKTYEFDCQTDRIKGGINLIPRFSIN
jgi:hypothetical protein